MFLDCGEVFTETAFIFGAGYKKQNAGKWELLNFIVGQAKISIYKSRKNKVNSTAGQQLTNMFLSLVKARVRVDFRFHCLMRSMEEFLNRWCFTTAVCSVVGEELAFNSVFV